jgi:class 3 adenylate cyclase/predicted ATPase
MNCPHCAAATPPGNKFCGQCGGALAVAAPRPTRAARAADASVERRQMTMVFCDIVESTLLSTRLDPEDLREIINQYHRCCAAAVVRFGGMIARYMGDGVLAYFGYPVAGENDAECAIRAGLAVLEGVDSLPIPSGPIRVRVGIATGLVVVGDLIGEGAAREQPVVGDTPNLAARLQTLAEPGTLVISRATRDLVGARFDLVDLGPCSLKGFDKPVPAWRVLREADARGRFEARETGERGLLVGREQELGRLLAAWTTARSGRGQVALVCGEPGLGKSRLVHALADRLSGQAMTRLTYYCSPFHRNSALRPVLDQLEHAAGFDRLDTPEQKREKLERFMSRHGDGGEVMRLLAFLLSLPGSERHPREDLSAQRQADYNLDTLTGMIADLARTAPLLIIVEDLHWIDPTSRALLERLNRLIADLPVLMVVTYRAEISLDWPGAQVTISLGRLSQGATLDLVAQLTGGKQIPNELRDQIVDKTDGIPLFVEELTKSILESGVLKETGGRFEMRLPVPSMSVPSTLRDSLMARLDRLAPVKEVAQIGAAIGRSFSYELLAAVSGLPEEELADALRQLVAAGLIFAQGSPPRSDYSFKHALVQDTAYDSLLRTRRRVLHAQIAAALIEHFPQIAAAQPELLAHHYTTAGDADRAVQHWLKAGQRAAERGGPRESVGHFERALDVLTALPPGPERDRREFALRLALVTPTMALSGYGSDATERTILRARALAEKIGETARIFPIAYGEWVSNYARGKIAYSRDLAENFLSLAERQTDMVPIVVGHRMLGSSLSILGELPAGRATLERCVQLYDPAQHGAAAVAYGQDSRVSAMSFLSWAQLALGDIAVAIDTAERAIGYAEVMPHANTQGVALCLAGAIFRGIVRDVPGIGACSARAIAVAEKQDLWLWLLAARVEQGWYTALQGEPEPALAQMRRALQDMKAIGVFIVRSHFCGLLAQVHAMAGQLQEGLAAMEEAMACLKESGERIWEADLHRIHGDLLLASGDKAGAEAALQLAIDVARRQGARFWELRAATSLAALWRDRGDRARARDLLTPLCDSFADAPAIEDVRALLKIKEDVLF